MVRQVDLNTLETNMKEAIAVYLQTTVLEEPMSSFVGTWQVGVTA